MATRTKATKAKGPAPASAKPRAKPLSEQLAELFDPTPKDFDPEQRDINVGEEADASVWDAAPEIEDAPAPVTGPRQLALRSDIELGKKYAGKRTTRDRFLEVSPEEDASETEASEEEEDEEDGEESEESGEEEEGDAEEESGSAEEASTTVQQPWEAAVQEADKLQAELEREEQEQSAGPAFVAPSEDDPRKAEHAKNQRRVFDAVLELRMKLQKPLAAANRLPAPEARTLFMAHNEQISSGYETLAEQLRSTLDEIQSLQKELITRNPTFYLPDDPVEMHELVMPFLDPVIEKWQLKTQIAAGGGIGGKRFRALNQSVGAQVKQVMTEKDKIVRKTQLLRSKVRILGSVEAAKDGAPQYSVEVYDDTDFYQQLLKDLIQQKADPQNPIQMTRSYLAQRAQVKHRKEVDRRASKGRKIRYKVHDKIVNFMAPVSKETPAVAAELFTRLFQN